VDGQAFQFLAGKEAHPLTIRREKGKAAAFCARQRLCLERVHVAEVQLRPTGNVRRVDQPSAVRRDRKRRRLSERVQLVARREGDRGARDGRRRLIAAVRSEPQPHGQAARDHEDGKRQHPSNDRVPSRLPPPRWFSILARRRTRVLKLDPCVADVAKALPRVLRETPPEQTPNRRGRAVRQGRPVRLTSEDRGHGVGHGLGGEGGASRQHLVEHAPEGPDVRAPVDRAAARLLRAHVGSRAENDAGASSDGRERRRLHRIGGTRGVEGSRQSEIQHLHPAVWRQLDVGRLQIAVHDALLVRRLHPLGYLAGEGDRFVHRYGAAADPLGQRRSLDELQHQRPDAVRLDDAVDRRDVRVVQRGERPRLPLEAGEPFTVGGKGTGQDLEGDVTPERLVMGAVHLSHAAPAERHAHVVRPQPVSWTQSHRNNRAAKAAQFVRREYRTFYL
jgi:hypothetical protein